MAAVSASSEFVENMHRLATQQRSGEGEWETCIIERHRESIFRSDEHFSIRFAHGTQDMTGCLYAKRHILARKAYYVISAVAVDLFASKENRSRFFLGKLKKKYNGAMFQGLFYDRSSGSSAERIKKDLIVVVVYDSEHSSTTDTKMEVGVGSSPSLPFLLDDFSDIRREGGQNYQPLSGRGTSLSGAAASTASILFFRQLDSNPAVMSTTASLDKFTLATTPPYADVDVDNRQVVHAKMTSSKNFQLVRSSTSSTFVAKQPVPQSTSDEGRADGNSGNNGNDGNIGGSGGSGHSDGVVELQMVKMDENVYDCCYRRNTFSLLQAFMVCLSRFETEKKF
jgi:hypothetical protein